MDDPLANMALMAIIAAITIALTIGGTTWIYFQDKRGWGHEVSRELTGPATDRASSATAPGHGGVPQSRESVDARSLVGHR